MTNHVCYPHPSIGREATRTLKTLLRLGTLSVLIFFAGILLLPSAQAQQDPPGCTGSGLGISLFVDKMVAHVGDTLHYSVIVYNSKFPACKVSEVRAYLATPDGVTNVITLKRTTLNPGEGDQYDNVAEYVVREEDVKGGMVTTATYDLARIHQNEDLSYGQAAQSVNTRIVTPCISIVPECTGGVGESGQIGYSATVSNCGDAKLANVTVSNVVDGVMRRVFGPVELAEGQSTNFSGTYKPANPCSPSSATFIATATDKMDAHVPPRTVTASGTTLCEIALSPSIALGQACAPAPVAGGTQYTYTGSVTNTGNVTLTNVVVYSDKPATSTVIYTAATLAPGASANFNAQFTAPLNACDVTIFLVVSADSRCGQPVLAQSSRTCALSNKPAIVVTETCPVEPVKAGEVLTFGGTVRNAGDVTLTNVVVVSARPEPNTVIFTMDRLEPGAQASFTGSFSTPVDTCSVTNTVTASGQAQCAGTQVLNSVTAICLLGATPAVAITKTCPEVPPGFGKPLVYGSTVVNTGDVTLYDLVVTSDRPAANTVVIRIPSLAPGASTNFTGNYTVPSNLNGCSITDTLSVVGRERCSSRTATASVTTTCPVQSAPKITIAANCPTTVTTVGTELKYTGTVSNSGDTTLTNVVVYAGAGESVQTVATIGTLAPGASATYSGSYIAPLDTCSSSITLTAVGIEGCGGTTVSHQIVNTCPLKSTPAIALTKSCPPEPVVPGELLVFTGTVTNIGNITLTNVVVVNNHPAENTHVFGPVTLAPGEGAAFTGSYTVATNANTCFETSTLYVQGRSQCDGSVASAAASSSCPVVTTPGVLITALCPGQPIPQNGLMQFQGILKNTGDITLTNLIVVSDQPSEGTFVFRASLLAPGQTTNFSGSFQVPVNCCEVISTYKVTAQDICGTATVTDTDTTVCPVVFNPAIKVSKVCPEQPVELGAELVLKGNVSNTGDITLYDVIVISDAIGVGSPVLGPIDLAPGEVVPYTVRYTVPVDFCGLDTMRASGHSMCGGKLVQDAATSTCPIKTTPGISVTNHRAASAVQGCVPVQAHAIVANTGDVTLVDVMVYANQPTNRMVFGPITLAPGASTNFMYEFSSPQTCDCCEIAVTLTATGKGKCDSTQVTSSSTAVSPLERGPKIELALDCPTGENPLVAGVVVTGIVRNSGDITLTNVLVVSSIPTEDTVVVGPINLAPGETQALSIHVTAMGEDTIRSLSVSATGQSICGGTPVGSTTLCAGKQLVAPQITLILQTEGGIRLSWSATAGTVYQVQYKAALSDLEWSNLEGTVTATGPTASKVDPAVSSSSRFYRIVALE